MQKVTGSAVGRWVERKESQQLITRTGRELENQCKEQKDTEMGRKRMP